MLRGLSRRFGRSRKTLSPSLALLLVAIFWLKLNPLYYLPEKCINRLFLFGHQLLGRLQFLSEVL